MHNIAFFKFESCSWIVVDNQQSRMYIIGGSTAKSWPSKVKVFLHFFRVTLHMNKLFQYNYTYNEWNSPLFLNSIQSDLIVNHDTIEITIIFWNTFHCTWTLDEGLLICWRRWLLLLRLWRKHLCWFLILLLGLLWKILNWVLLSL